ncbi:N-acyl homoserine lactonase family protein [Alicyclobacillus fastidiosus]|uniref:N-acyl homoserine lactonase family protein n=1 Tax=Alicyclobacillus fastidiosus TaxID=392011 RepID=A0ABV5AIQ1_9BACL|nr:N-acyl homoserine lactonase family protein [Alicyclobacillus fastidiosus]WEH07810.1 N-acyl homoserine lactonase family protein [Alicyclobacillus fastidiosus]
MAVERVYLLPAGHCLVDQSVLNETLVRGKLVNLPIWSYLIETTEGPMLIDTGMPEAYAVDTLGDEPKDGDIVPWMTHDDAIVQVLARAGYAPDDLLCVISSHWHFDHAGGNSKFPNTPIYVQRAEYDAAMVSDDYPAECRVAGLDYRLIEGDYQLAPGVDLIFTPGHSAGHQSILLHTRLSGPILLTVDAAYTRENFEDGVPFAGVDPLQIAASIAHLKEVVQAVRPRVFFGHDVEQGNTWPVYPKPL